MIGAQTKFPAHPGKQCGRNAGERRAIGNPLGDVEWIRYVWQKRERRDVARKGEWEKREQQSFDPEGKDVRWVLGGKISSIRHTVPHFGGIG